MRVVWICGFSNAEVRSRLEKKTSLLEPLFWKAVGRSYDSGADAGVWVTNGIAEMQYHNDVELHVITPCRDLVGQRQEFAIGRVEFHFIRDENSGLYRKVLRYLFTRNSSEFRKNRRNILRIINEVEPDLVHVIGAENPNYSLALLDIPKSIPTILQLQALLLSLRDKVAGDKAVNFAYKGRLEAKLIQEADYIGTCVQSYIDYIRANVKSDVKIVNTTLAMGQTIDLSDEVKEFTFVHFAGRLGTTKATDVALRAFALAYKTHPGITLDVVGGCDEAFMEQLKYGIAEAGLENAVSFEGRLPTHEDVIRQIRKARFALLPLKTDIVPNTIHEAMANGLPVVTTATEGGTTRLNETRESVLISPIGDAEGVSANMQYLLDHPDKAEELRQNAAATEGEYENNHDVINHWIEVYKAVLLNASLGEEIPKEFLL